MLADKKIPILVEKINKLGFFTKKVNENMIGSLHRSRVVFVHMFSFKKLKFVREPCKNGFELSFGNYCSAKISLRQNIDLSI